MEKLIHELYGDEAESFLTMTVEELPSFVEILNEELDGEVALVVSDKVGGLAFAEVSEDNNRLIVPLGGNDEP